MYSCCFPTIHINPRIALVSYCPLQSSVSTPSISWYIDGCSKGLPISLVCLLFKLSEETMVHRQAKRRHMDLLTRTYGIANTD